MYNLTLSETMCYTTNWSTLLGSYVLSVHPKCASTLYCAVPYIAPCVDVSRTVFRDHSLWCRGSGSCSVCRRLCPYCIRSSCDLVLHIWSMWGHFYCLKSLVSCCENHYNRMVWLYMSGGLCMWLYLSHYWPPLFVATCYTGCIGHELISWCRVCSMDYWVIAVGSYRSPRLVRSVIA